MEKIKVAIKRNLKDIHLVELLKGSSIAFGFKVTGLATGYLFFFLISAYYGAAGIGIYSLSFTVLSIVGIVGMMGFNCSVLRFVAHFSSEKNLYKIKVLYRDILQLTIPLSILLSISFYFLADKIAINIFNNDNLSFAFKIFSFIISFYVINQINIEIIRGFKNIKLSEYIRNFNTQLFNILIFISINFFVVSYYIPVFSYSFAIIISFSLSTYIVYEKLRKSRKEKIGILSKNELIKVSSPMMFTELMHLIMGSVDIIMLGILSSMENVGIYSMALKLASLTSFILLAVNTIAAPKFSELFWSDKINDLKIFVRSCSTIIFWTSVPVLIILITFNGFFMELFGKEFIVGKHALVLLSLGGFVNAASGSVGYILNMTGKHYVFRNIVFIATLINVALNITLIPRYGITGAAIATMTSMMFWNITAAIYIKSEYNIKSYYIPWT